jgi:F-type H+-transporting ATPase subunit gamma
VVVGSQQGLSGQFNEEISRHAAARIDEFGRGAQDRRVLALGGQIVPRLRSEGVPVHRSVSLPGSVDGITGTVQETLLNLLAWREDGVERFVLLHHRPLGGARFEPRIVHLLPLDLTWLRRLEDAPWESRSLPTHFADWRELFAALVREYLFVALYRGVGESLAAENASRLAAMQAAEKNIDERLEELRAAYNHERQSSITAELLDIVSGYSALTDREGL